MHFSTVVVASLLTAFASAEVAFPAKRSMYFNHLQKREGACGDASKGKCCDAQDVNGKMVYTECPSGECQKRGEGYFCCETGTCTTFVEDCTQAGGHWGDDYVCHKPEGAGAVPYFAPKDQAEVVQSAMAEAAETGAAAAASSAAAATASAILSEASASASAIESAGSELASSILGAGAEPTAAATATGTEEAPTGTEVAAPTDASSETGAEGSQLPMPTQATNSAERVMYSTSALLMAVVAGVFML